MNGSLTISNPSDGMVRIEIKDDLSRRRFIEVKVSHDELMKAIMGLAERPVTLKVKDLDKVGKTMRTQHLRVAIPKGLKYSDNEKRTRTLEYIREEIDLMREQSGKSWECIDRTLASQNTWVTIDEQDYVNTVIAYWE